MVEVVPEGHYCRKVVTSHQLWSIRNEELKTVPKIAVRGSALTLVLLELACVVAKDRPRANGEVARSYSEKRTGLVSGRAGNLSLMTYIPCR